MKKSIGVVFLSFVFLTVLLSGCAPASTPLPPTSTFTPIPPTDTPVPTATNSLPTILADPATTMFTNEDEGFSFRFPSEYHIIISDGSICLTLAQLDVRPSSCHVANAYVETRNADGHTLQEIADAVAGQGNPTIPVVRTNIKIGGDIAILMDDFYTYDVLSKIVVVHNGLIVELTFLHWGEGSGEFSRIQSLYEIVTDSFSFLER